MLSRTADHLFWMARYMERAENTARMLDVNYQTSLLPQSAAAAERGWRGPAQHQRAAAGDFAKRYGEVDAAQRDGLHGAATSTTARRSAAACMRGARERARGARHADHRGLGDAEPDLARVPAHAARRTTSSATRATLFEWVKFRSHLSRGVTVGTMLQDEAFHFLRIGTFLERADNTARLLDVKFHARAERVLRRRPTRSKDQEFDFYHWSRHPALGLRLRGLPQGLPQRDPAREGGRAADPARRTCRARSPPA